MRLALGTSGLLVGSVIFFVAKVVAGPILHERFAPDPAEDLRLGATTASGRMPAALQTKSGVVSAPEETLGSDQDGARSYGGSKTPNSADSNYYIDRLTTRPDRVKYDEPFRPTILPFKRLYAFDAVSEDLSFHVASKDLRPVAVGGEAQDTEDAFFGDFVVDLVENVPVRIPSVGPGTRIRALHTDPPVGVEILEDSAENWFARGVMGGRVRMVVQLSIERQTFGSLFHNATFEQLALSVPEIPDLVRRAGREVGEEIGVRSDQSPAAVLMTLVDYFRRFHESDQMPVSVDPVDLYRELSLDQKGVCRHRSYAFTITALAHGLPTRLVYNEAHAWVEVFDTEIWHRIDLGGAATNISETRQDWLAPEHRPPPDPYTWPKASQPTLPNLFAPRGSLGADAGSLQDPSSGAGPTGDASQPLVGQQASDDVSGNPMGRTPGGPGNPGRAPWGAANGPTSARDAQSDALDVPAEIELHLKSEELLRGRPLGIDGVVTRGGRPCPLSRVDIFISHGDSWKAIGSVASNRSGEFSGQVTVPQATPVGPLSVTARVVGGCP